MLQPSDYIAIGILANHCDLSKLKIAENEAYEFDLPVLFCDFWDELSEIYVEVETYIEELVACEADPDCETPPVTPEDYTQKYNLIYGGNYTGCNGKNRSHKGVKKMLIYYSYARYIVLNGFNDTATGFKAKTNDFSLPIPLKELNDFSDKYRSMGLSIFKGIVGYMCANTEYFDWNDCKKCGCGTEKCGGITTKGYGFTGSNITKRI